MFGRPLAPVAMPCPACHGSPVAVVFRYFSTIVLMCPLCEHVWNAEPGSDAVLAALPRIDRTHPS
jgi:hypothetical protein